VVANARRVNPGAAVLQRDSTLLVAEPERIRGRRVLVVEDGPTTTHGGMRFGAGVLAARRYGAAEIVDPRPFAVGEIRDTFERYPDIGTLLPAMGYGETQVGDLAATIAAAECDLVLIATPIDLRRLIDIDKPCLRVGYELAAGDGALAEAVRRVIG
jgi:predicted GTPase